MHKINQQGKPHHTLIDDCMHVHAVYQIAWIAIHVSQTMSYQSQICDCTSH